MKKLIVFMLCMTALTACNQKNSNAEDLRLTQQGDSLNRIIAQKKTMRSTTCCQP